MIGILNSIRSFLKSKSAQDESELNNSGVEKNKKRKVSGLWIVTKIGCGVSGQNKKKLFYSVDLIWWTVHVKDEKVTQ